MSLEIIVLVALFMLLFGYRKLPEIGHALGQAPREFENATQEDDS